MTFNSLMHPRNMYSNPPDFKLLGLEFPEFANFVIEKGKKMRVDFKDPAALRALTTVLLKKDFNLTVTIPEHCLIPTVPMRLNYILWMEDLLQKLSKSTSLCKAIDIGTGPCCIFSLLGARKNGWHFRATEVNDESFEWAKKNVDANDLNDLISVVKVSEDDIISQLFSNESNKYDFCMCNPPFFGNMEDFQRKRKFSHGRKQQEALVDGGEAVFVKKIIDESKVLQEKVQIYSSMLGRKKSSDELVQYLKSIDNINYTTCEFGQGNTVRWGVAWTYVPNIYFDKVKTNMPKPKPKVKDAFTFTVLADDSNMSESVKDFLPRLETALNEFKIPYKKLLEETSVAHFKIIAYENTWVHQRKRRRELRKMQEQTMGHSSSTIVHTPTESLEHAGNTVLDTANNQELHKKHPRTECVNSEDPEVLLNSDTSENREQKEILNCNIAVNEMDQGVMLRFTCSDESFRCTMHQVFELLRRKLAS